MFKYIGWPGKGHGARQMVLLPLFFVVELDLKLKVRYLKIELKVLFGFLFWDLIVCLRYTNNGNAEIIIVVN